NLGFGEAIALAGDLSQLECCRIRTRLELAFKVGDGGGFPGVGSTIGIAAAAADPGDLPATPGTEIGGDFWCLAGAHLDGVDRTTLTDGTLQFGPQLPGKLLNQGQGLLFVVVARCLFGCPTRRGEGTKGNQRRGQ